MRYTFEDLIHMRETEIVEYLNSKDYTKDELVKLLEDNDIPYKKAMSRKALVGHVAESFSSIGMFKRIGSL